MNQSETIDALVAQFTKLPGVGKKSAIRYAYAVIDMPEEDVHGFADALVAVKQHVHFCKVCGNYTDGEVCDICATRHSNIICVVTEPKDIVAFEKLNEFHGVYHVLHGLLQPMKGVGADDLNIASLLDRLDGVDEVIVATNPSVEGNATALYLSRLIKPLGVKVTRIAMGIPAGSEIEYADETTLSHALWNRKEI